MIPVRYALRIPLSVLYPALYRVQVDKTTFFLWSGSKNKLQLLCCLIWRYKLLYYIIGQYVFKVFSQTYIVALQIDVDDSTASVVKLVQETKKVYVEDRPSV